MRNEHVQKKDRLHILFVGNVRSGKSFLLNSAVGQIFSKSSDEEEYRCTKQIQSIKKENIIYIDTPGIDDLADDMSANEAIQKSIRSSKRLKLVFIVKLDEGKVNPADFVTVRFLLDAFEAAGISMNNKYGLIVNKWTENEYTKYENEFLLNFIEDTLLPTESIAMFPLVKEAESQPNFLCKQECLGPFLDSIPEIHEVNLKKVRL